VDDFELSPNGRIIAFATNEEGQSQIKFLELKSRQVSIGPKLPPGQAQAMSWRPNSLELGFSWVSSGIPGDVYSYDLANRRLTRWTESETGGLDASAFHSARDRALEELR